MAVIGIVVTTLAISALAISDLAISDLGQIASEESSSPKPQYHRRLLNVHVKCQVSFIYYLLFFYTYERNSFSIEPCRGGFTG